MNKLNKYIKQNKKPEPSFDLFDEDRNPILTLSLRECSQLDTHPQKNEYIEKLKSKIKSLNEENEENELNEVDELLEKIQNPELIKKSQIDIKELDKSLNEMTTGELIESLFNRKQNTDLCYLLESVDNNTLDFLIEKIDSKIEKNIDNILETEIQDIKQEIIESVNKFFNETTPSYFIKQEIIENMNKTPLFLNEISSLQNHFRDNYNEIRNEIKENIENSYFNRVFKILKSLNPVVFPEISREMTKSEIDRIIKSNPQELLYNQVLSKMKSEDIQESKLQDLEINRDKQNKEIQESKPKEKLFEWYPKIIKGFSKVEDNFYKDIGITEEYDKEVLESTLNRELTNMINESLITINSISELFPLEEFFNLSDPRSLLSGFLITQKIQKDPKYKERKRIIENKIKSQNKTPKEFPSDSRFEKIMIEEYSFNVLQENETIFYEIIF